MKNNPFEEAGISKKTELQIKLSMAADALINNPMANSEVAVKTMSETEAFLKKHEFIDGGVLETSHLIKSKAFDALLLFMGHLQNGSQTDVKVWQDDAAVREESVHLIVGKNGYCSGSLIGCIQQAIAAGECERG